MNINVSMSHIFDELYISQKGVDNLNKFFLRLFILYMVFCIFDYCNLSHQLKLFEQYLFCELWSVLVFFGEYT